MSAPETEAGRALRKDLAWTADVVRHDDAYLPAILRIEREAARIGADSMAAEAIRRVEEAWTAHGAISQAVVIRILRDLADA